MSPIKLYLVETLSDGTKRLQSQLLLGRLTCDFIQEPDGSLMYWNLGARGFNWYPVDSPVTIITDISEMSNQTLNNE